MGGGGGTGTTLGGISGTELGDSLRTLCLISWDKIKRTMHTQRTARVEFDGVAQDNIRRWTSSQPLYTVEVIS